VTERFLGNVIVVAGGTGGLGRAVSEAFLAEGATVIVSYHTRSEFDTLMQAVGPNAARLKGEAVDVTDEAAVKQFIGGVIAQYDRLDAVVNTVGGYEGGEKLWEFDTKVLDHMLALNLRSGYALARAVVPAMIKQGRGAIVNAELALMDSLAAEVAGSGVRINSVLPSIIDTEANRRAMPTADYSKWPKPEDIARVILFLCSADAKVIHGAAIPVYGAQ
jgi:NAD(P)-dependent dehydrogenase (short-subunit alcohol dehydrogenase family)